MLNENKPTIKRLLSHILQDKINQNSYLVKFFNLKKIKSPNEDQNL